jgi:hypothetical protein
MAFSDFSAKRATKRQSPIDVSSSALPKLPVSSSPVAVVPRTIVRSPRPQPGKFVFSDPKRVLQHYRGKSRSHRSWSKTALLTRRGPHRSSALGLLRGAGKADRCSPPRKLISGGASYQPRCRLWKRTVSLSGSWLETVVATETGAEGSSPLSARARVGTKWQAGGGGAEYVRSHQSRASVRHRRVANQP